MCIIAAINNVVHFRTQNRNAHIYSLVFFALFVCCVGHLELALSTTEEGARIALIMCYAGSVFLPFFVFCATLQVCKIHLPSAIKLLLFSLSFAILGFVCTIGYSDFYYKSFEYVVSSGVGNYYVDEYGPGHDIFNFALLLYLVASFGTIIYSIVTKRNVSYKSLVAMAMIESASIVSFLLARHMENDMLIMPAVYVFDQFVTLYMCLYVKRYDLTQSVLQALEEDNSNGYVSISENLKYLGGNEIALSYFPDLKNCRIDHTLDSKSTVTKFFKDWILEIKKGTYTEEKEFSVDDRHFKCFAKKTSLSGKSYATLFRIEEDTAYYRYVQMLGSDNSRLEQLAKANATQIHAIQEQMIIGMANMVESRDSSTGGHIKRTSKVVSILAEELLKHPDNKYDEKFFAAVVTAAPMHDLGKIAIDDQILRKPGKFTDEEFSIMKSHAEKGAVIVENLLSQIEEPHFIQIAKNVANYHHERYDGNGYPSRLSGEQIPYEARIMAIADVYDALVSKRCYKSQMSFAEANEIIMNSMGTHFDPSLKQAFINCKPKLEEYYSNIEH